MSGGWHVPQIVGSEPCGVVPGAAPSCGMLCGNAVLPASMGRRVGKGCEHRALGWVVPGAGPSYVCGVLCGKAVLPASIGRYVGEGCEHRALGWVVPGAVPSCVAPCGMPWGKVAWTKRKGNEMKRTSATASGKR
eukprot:1158219-Pelagomonas_calceolata.AAC.2